MGRGLIMNTVNKTKLTVEQFAEIEAKLQSLKTEVDNLFQFAWDNEAFRLGRDLADIAGSLQGLSYMTHPQTEWLGGDSGDPKNFTRRFPHIAALD